MGKRIGRGRYRRVDIFLLGGLICMKFLSNRGEKNNFFGFMYFYKSLMF